MATFPIEHDPQARPGEQPDAERAQLLAAGWAALPAAYRPPSYTPSLEEARRWCQHLTETHYENFHVASIFLPARMRTHFHAIYAYCRVSDDLGDEVGDAAQSLALLDWWQEQLELCYRGIATHPVFVALLPTIQACNIPIKPFADLLHAFRQDQHTTRFASIEDVLDYCRYSANPVGRLVLYVAGYRDEERFRLSDQTCTALQLANFWQDVRVDHEKGRIYLPQADMKRFKVTEAMLAEGIAARVANPAVRELLRYEVGYARVMFRSGMPLIGMVNRELAVDLDLFSRGGLEILRAIEKQEFDVLCARPSISKPRKAALLLHAIAGKYLRLRGSKG
ncbi:squalene synthase HpnC [Acidipila sp. EB88]|uniref:squalene synthase HpnC n=1 Tax=Acidipila sp. EB88 TaxID=2305226 RepID=UPI000F5EAA5A|nr:squalene synthase HpnC [Acidipila sp. EB88]RRA49465.1 squalene synthase HpnC [Acidipila sp. EB88]